MVMGMDDKEIIVDLLNDLQAKGFWSYGIDQNTGEEGGHDLTPEDIADYLMENGVTVPVRCKDCRHWLKDVPGCIETIRRCRFGNYMVGTNGYCVYGERKGNETV